MTSKEARAARSGSGGTTVMERASTAVSDAGAQVREGMADSAALVAQHAPAAMTASRGSAKHALVMLRESATDSLVLGTVFAAGASGGMLLSRAPRLLVAVAFVPALVLGGMLLGRRGMGLDAPAHAGRR
jgi:hypothetical protein